MRLIPLLLAIVMAAPVAAQHAHSATGHDMGGPQETGQSAFAALAEIVAILQADPETVRQLAAQHHARQRRGAGGAGLRAAVAAIDAGLSVGVVCKSLLGKAHTVMAEGGMAASLAHVDDRDTWSTHFRDTMVGGYRLNNPRMAV